MEKGIKFNHLEEKTLREIIELSRKNIMEEAQKNPLFAKVIYSRYKALEKIAPFRNNVELDLLKLKMGPFDLTALKKSAERAK